MNPVLNLKPTKDININSYTKKKLDIDTTKIEKAIVKLKKTILNHDEELKLKEKELIELELELNQLNNLKKLCCLNLHKKLFNIIK